MTYIYNIVVVIFFVFLNAFFVVSEFSMVKIRKSQVDIMEAGVIKKYVKLVTDNLNAYLSACQLGITLASLALGWIGEPAVSLMISPLLIKLGLSEATIHAISIALGFSVITALHIVIGELVPKSLAILSTEKWVKISAIPLVCFYRLTYPIMWLFNTVTNGILKLVGHSLAEECDVYSDAEIKMLLGESCKQGLIPQERYEYVDNIFEMEEIDAKNIMTPRTDMVCLYLEDSMEEHLKTVAETKFTRYPVCKEEKDNIVGFIHIKDLYAMQYTDESSLESIIREIQVVHESISVSKLIHVFREEKTKIAVIVDEHGGTCGIVTLSDVFTEIVGEIEDEYTHGDEEECVEVSENHFLVDASLEVEELTERFGLEIDDSIESETIGGFVLEQVGELPEVDDKVEYENLIFTIKELDNFKIKTVEIEVHNDPEE